ncbi:MAG TPA: PA0069 family radical SAM protein [Leadbetterella sp.]|nr:PA0069 family radical SAM protein [Leadbetterella sp.]
MKGQGAVNNVKNRFDKTETVPFWENDYDYEEIKTKTEFIKVHAKTIVNQVKSTDLPFVQSLNPYQGCEHGCSYCYARPTHEYWSLNAGVDFERKILYKPDAPTLLEKHFQKRNYVPHPISFSGNTDCYQPAERKFMLTRQLLEVCLKYKHPLTIITKNALVLRDLDILKKLREDNLVAVALSITTLDEETRRVLEPRTSSAANKLRAMKVLSENNIPVFGMIAPIIPAINSHEIFALAEQFYLNGAFGFSSTMVRLNDTVEPIFMQWARTHFPDRADKILNQIRSLHGGNLGSKIPKERMKGSGILADSLQQSIKIAKDKFFPNFEFPKLNDTDFLPLHSGQLSLF